jgi:hypothetical protein
MSRDFALAIEKVGAFVGVACTALASPPSPEQDSALIGKIDDAISQLQMLRAVVRYEARRRVAEQQEREARDEGEEAYRLAHLRAWEAQQKDAGDA